MKYFVMKVAVCFLRLIYIPLRWFHVQKKVTLISRQSNSKSLDMSMLIKYLEQHYPQIYVKSLTRKLEPGLRNKLFYGLHMFVQMYHVATSKAVVVDGYCIIVSVLKHKKQTKFIQMWHALGAVKKFGYQTLDKPSGNSHKVAEIMCMHKNYDYILCSSEATASFFCEGFCAQPSKIVYLGLPRIDYILERNLRAAEDIYEKYPDLKNKDIVLYVPTFRNGKSVKVDELVVSLNLERYKLVVKLHPLDAQNTEIRVKGEVLYDNAFRSYDWLEVCQRVITDYSALGIEASLANKPVYFYIYDVEEYQRDPGLNIEFENEAIGKYVFRRAEGLAEAMTKPYDYEALNLFKKKYVSFESTDNTKQLAEFIRGIVYDKD